MLLSRRPPDLTAFRTIVYEYGDPPAELFGSDSARRAAEVRHKQREVYPHVSEVLAISDFIAADVGWPTAKVVVLGVEHIPDLGPKQAASYPDTPLRVGALMRLGEGEARYKGTEELLALAADNPDLSWEFAGRGTESQAHALRSGGFRTVLNPTDAQRTQFLRDIDVFVTLSRWEGTDLPMVEAEALGLLHWHWEPPPIPSSRRSPSSRRPTSPGSFTATRKIAIGCSWTAGAGTSTSAV